MENVSYPHKKNINPYNASPRALHRNIYFITMSAQQLFTEDFCWSITGLPTNLNNIKSK